MLDFSSSSLAQNITQIILQCQGQFRIVTKIRHQYLKIKFIEGEDDKIQSSTL
jgi:hypothetical protein